MEIEKCHFDLDPTTMLEHRADFSIGFRLSSNTCAASTVVTVGGGIVAKQINDRIQAYVFRQLLVKDKHNNTRVIEFRVRFIVYFHVI